MHVNKVMFTVWDYEGPAESDLPRTDSLWRGCSSASTSTHTRSYVWDLTINSLQASVRCPRTSDVVYCNQNVHLDRVLQFVDVNKRILQQS